MTTLVLALQDASPVGNAFEGGWRSAAALVIVFGLLGTLAWFARRGVLPGSAGRRLSTPVRLDGMVSLGDRRSLVVVEVDERRLLVGVAPGSVTLITELGAKPFDRALGVAVAAGETRA